jgi:hypothetical protein
MTAALKSHDASESASGIDAIMSDLASLRRDFVTLTDHLKTGAINGATGAARDAAGQIGDEAKRMYGRLAEQGERSRSAIVRQVEERPIACLLTAFALGFVGSRLLLR